MSTFRPSFALLLMLIAPITAAVAQSGGPDMPHVLFPNGGDSLRVGRDTTIRWEGTGADEAVTVEYSIDAGATWRQITDAAKGGSLSWKVPPPVSNSCLLRVSRWRPVSTSWGWARVAGGPKTATATAMAVDSSGNVIIAGTIRDSATFDDNRSFVVADSLYSLFVAKYTGDGALLWTRRFDVPSQGFVNDMAVGANGDILLVGGFRDKITFQDGTVIGDGDWNGDYVLAARLSADGALTWHGLEGVIGHADGIATTADGGFHISGTYQKDADFGGGVTLTGTLDQDIFLVRFGAGSGAPSAIWGRSFRRHQYVSSLDFTAPHRVALDAAGNIYLCGAYRDSLVVEGTALPGGRTPELYLIRVRPDGAIDWTRRVELNDNLNGAGNIYPFGLAFAPPDRIYIAGRYYGRIVVPPSDTISSLNPDGFLLQFGTDGVPRWVRATHDESLTVLTGVASDGAGYAYVTGESFGRPDLGNGIALTTHGNGDVILARYAPDGTPIWGRISGSPNFELGNAIETAPNGNLFVAGDVVGPAELGDGIMLRNPVIDNPSTNSFSAFVASYNARTGWVQDRDTSDALWTIYSPARLELSVGDASGAPGQRVAIPVAIDGGSVLSAAGVDTVRATLSFNGSLLVPAAPLPAGVTIDPATSGARRMLRFAIPTSDSLPHWEASLPFVVAVGDSVATGLTWGGVEASAAVPSVVVRNGRFDLLGCDVGGARLVAVTGAGSRIALAAPDPARDRVSVAIDMGEDDASSLLLLDELGRIIRQEPVVGHGHHEISMETGNLATGTYTLLLRTPTGSAPRRIRIIR